MENTRQMLVDAASRCFRRKGLAGATLADIMTSVGMTTGGFYRHFASKDDLTEHALNDDLLDVIAESRQKGSALEETIDAMCDWALNPVHEITESAAAAFASEISRQSVAIQRAFTKHTAERIAAIAACFPESDHPAAFNRARAIYSILVGAAQLSRFDPATGNSVRDHILQIAEGHLSPR